MRIHAYWRDSKYRLVAHRHRIPKVAILRACLTLAQVVLISAMPRVLAAQSDVSVTISPPGGAQQTNSVSVLIQWCGATSALAPSTMQVTFNGSVITSQFDYVASSNPDCVGYAESHGTITLSQGNSNLLEATMNDQTGPDPGYGSANYSYNPSHVSVTPDGGTAMSVPIGTNGVAVFNVTNDGTNDATANLSLSCSTPLTSCMLVSPASVWLPIGRSAPVVVSYKGGASTGSGTISVTATYAEYPTTSDGGSMVAQVTSEAGVARIVLDAPPLLLRQGASAVLRAHIYDVSGRPVSGRSIGWSSSNGAIVSVGTNWNDSVSISGAGVGSATITATNGSVSTTAFVSTQPSGSGPAIGVQSAPVNPQGNIERGQCLTIAAGEGAAYECGDLRVLHALPATTTMNRTRAPVLIYDSRHAAGLTYLAANVLVSGFTPDSLIATLTIPGYNPITQRYSWASGNCQLTQVCRIAVPIDGSSAGIPTGLYSYTLQVVAKTSSASATNSDQGQVVLIDRSQSMFGAGWWIDGFEQLLPVAGRNDQKLWIGGDGSTRVYTQVGASSIWLVTPAVDRPDTLEARTIFNGQTGFRRHIPNGAFVDFDASGWHVGTVNAQGHTTVFWHSASTLDSLSVPVPAGQPNVSYSFTYDRTGAPILTVVSAPTVTGISRNVTFSHSGRQITKIQDRGGPADTVAFAYDPRNRILRRRNQLLDSTTFTYDPAGALSRASLDMSRTDGAGAHIDRGFCAAETRSIGCSSGPALLSSAVSIYDGPRTDANDTLRFHINAYGAPDTAIVSAFNYISRVKRDPAFPLLADTTIQPTGHKIAAIYNIRGLPDSVIDLSPFGDGRNAVSRFVWNAKWNRPDRTISPTGLVKSFAYNTITGLRATEQLGLNGATQITYGYSTRNQLTSITTPLSATPIRFTYADQRGNLDSEVTARGFKTIHLRDGIGRDTLTKVQADTNVWRTHTTTYDALDRVLSTVDNGSLHVATTYDLISRPLTIARWAVPDTSHLGVIKDSTVYDAAGRRRRSIDAMRVGVVEKWGYDAAGDVVVDSLKNGEVVPMAYDALGRLVQRIIDNVHTDFTPVLADTSVFVYDALGNATVANGRFAKIHRTYAPNGTLLTDELRILPADVSTNDTTTHVYRITDAYDVEGRRTALIQPSNLRYGRDTVYYGYDPETGALGNIADVSSKSYRYIYNAAGLRSRLDEPGGIIDSLAYDPDGNRKERWEVRRNGSADSVLHHEVFSVTPIGQITDVSSNNTASIGTFSYNVDGSIRRSFYNDQSDDVQSTDPFGNQVKLKRNTSENFITYGFVYDSSSTRLLKRGGYGGDACNFPMQDSLSQGYDLAGQLTGTTYTSWGGYRCPTIQTGWPITSWSTTDNHYAANGQLTYSKRGTSEDVHRTDKLFLKTYGYTKLVADPSLGRGVYQENRYDALGRRIWVRELRDRYCTAADRTATSECLGAVTRTIWDGDRVLYEIRQPGDSGTAATTMESDVASTAHNAFYGIAEYTHGDDLDEPLGMIRDTSGVLTLVLHRQWRGQVDQSTWAVNGAKADCAITGQTGCLKVNWPGADVLIDYTRPPSDSGPPSWMGSLAQGMRDATHQMYMRNRYYDPITERFTQEDPIGLAGGLNVYGFAGGDPVNYSDPFGLNPCLAPPVAPACLEAVAVGGAAVIAILLTKAIIDQTVGNSIPLVNNWSTDRMPTGKIRKLWEELWGKKWPTEPSGRPYDADHDIPLADGGTDTPDNVTPRTHDDHVQRHKDNGDFARWGRRGKKQEPKPQEPPQRPQDPQNPQQQFLLL